jgi:hypothetical protein
MHKRRASGGKHSKVAQPEVPFGRRQFSKKKKIRPVWKNVFNKNKSPKHDPAPKTTGLINFFRNLRSSSNDSHQSGKSKISKGYSSEDKESGHVTRFAPPPPSPKHKKNSSKRAPKQEISLPSYQEAQLQYNEASSPRFDLTPTNVDNEPFFHQAARPAVCSCGQCRECMFRMGDVSSVGRHGSGTMVTRNESYRSMKPLPRTHSIPVEYDASGNVVSNNPNSANGGDSNRSTRSRSFRDKLGFLPDKSKNSKS